MYNVIITCLSSIAAITVIINNIFIIQAMDEMLREYLTILAVIVILILFCVFVVISSIFVIESIYSIVREKKKGGIKVVILEKPQICIGGAMIFNVKFSGWFLSGYFKIYLKSPYWEEKSILIRYDEVKKSGKIKGKYNEEKIQLRCNIPNNWSPGEYDIIVSIHDKIYAWIPSFNRIKNLASESLVVKIDCSVE